jgi:hypothetical protein
VLVLWNGLFAAVVAPILDLCMYVCMYVCTVCMLLNKHKCSLMIFLSVLSKYFVIVCRRLVYVLESVSMQLLVCLY